MRRPVRLEPTPLEEALRATCLGMLGRGRHMLIQDAALKTGVSSKHLSAVLNGYERGTVDLWGELLELLGVEISLQAAPKLLTARELDAICDEEQRAAARERRGIKGPRSRT